VLAAYVLLMIAYSDEAEANVVLLDAVLLAVAIQPAWPAGAAAVAIARRRG